MIRNNAIARPLFTLLFVYLFALGGTFNGVLIPGLKLFSLALLAVLVSGWLLLHRRPSWNWHRTPLDVVLVMWCVAFGLSLLFNLDSSRRIMIGLWYMGLYIGLWYLLYELIANRALQRAALIDAFLFAGLVVVGFAFYEVRGIDFDPQQFELPRPGSVIGNPNALGTFLIVLLSLAIGRLFSVRNRPGQVVLAGYVVLTGLLLIMTFSRGAWLGMAAALFTFGLLIYVRRSEITGDGFGQWWSAGSSKTMFAISAAIMFGFVLTGFLLAFFLSSLEAPGRDPGLRTEIYGNALSIIGGKPVVGHGPFTFGQQLARYQSQPPRQPHSHAHSAPLQVAAELGIVGLAALGASLLAVLRTSLIIWRIIPERERWLVGGGMAAAVGWGVHHLLDTPAMMPLLAITGIISLALICTPPEPIPLVARWRRIGHPIALTILWIGLLASGFWSTSVYTTYNEALIDAINERDYRTGAERMQVAIDADPNMALYHNQQAYLYGIAAALGDDEARDEAIHAYERFLDLEPQHAASWANYAALLWSADRPGDAIRAMARAAELAPAAWQFYFALGGYYEAEGDEISAQAAYRRALTNDSRAYPGWDTTSLTRIVADGHRAEGVTQVVLAASADGALDLGEAQINILRMELCETQDRTRIVIACLLVNDLDDADAALRRAESLALTNEHLAWVHVGRGIIAAANEDAATAQAERAAARALITPDFALADWRAGTNIPHFQFLRYAIPRQFLPQTFFPAADPALLRLLADS